MKSVQKAPSSRTEDDIDILMPLINRLAFFKQLPTRVVRHLVKVIEMVQVPSKRLICEQGNSGDTMYVILSGSCAVFQCDEETRKKRKCGRLGDDDWSNRGKRKTSGDGNNQYTQEKSTTDNDDAVDGKKNDQKIFPKAIQYSQQWYGDCVANLLPGDSFGEKSVISGEKRNATVITREKTRMFLLEKKHYDVIAQLGKAFFLLLCCCKDTKVPEALKIYPFHFALFLSIFSSGNIISNPSNW